MQSGRNAMESVKESAANVAASARSGMEKAKATAQEKVENLTGGDPIQRQMAREKKDSRIAQAELQKLESRDQNAAAKLGNEIGAAHPGYTAAGAGTGTATYSTTGAPGHIPGTHQMSALPGHGTGQPAGEVTEGMVGTNTGTQRSSAAHNTGAGAGAGGYGTGGYYTG